MDTVQQQQQLIKSLCNPACYDHPVDKIEVMETHISWVILTGSYAYKLKKGVDFGFLDYSSLEKRKMQCNEELHLNRRTAPQIYLEVVPIGGSTDNPILHHEPALEYAVKMRQFPQPALLSRHEERGELSKEAILALADAVAEFHSGIEVAAPDSPYGTPDNAYYPVNENFEQIRERIEEPALLERLDQLEQHSRTFFEQHRELFTCRKAEGFIRDCHGDLHLNNILLLDDKPLLFDCIEFNPNLRIIDVISELAFLVMDLDEHGRCDLANILLNRYLERTGDYDGLRLISFYLGYRAMVRAKVAILRLDQDGLDVSQKEKVIHDFTAYMKLAERYTRAGKPRLFITHGLSGSGKTTLTQPLLSQPGVIRIRSDVERKRLFGLDSLAKSQSAVGENIYTADATRRTYGKLLQLTDSALAGGYTVIVDATFLKREERDHFRQLAQQCNSTFSILSFTADANSLHQRVSARSEKGGDASEANVAVLQHQLDHYQPPGNDEIEEVFTIDSTDNNSTDTIKALVSSGIS